jgi:uncharacterized OB-fold protein
MTARYVAEGLIEEVGGEPHLLGGRRRSDGKVVFPMPNGAEASRYEKHPLPSEGKLWSYTIQRFRPKTPYNGPGDDKSFKPYAVGYVELPGEVIVESRLETDDFDSLKIGMPMRFTVQTFRKDADGAEVRTYAFRPA